MEERMNNKSQYFFALCVALSVGLWKDPLAETNAVWGDHGEVNSENPCSTLQATVNRMHIGMLYIVQ